MPRHRPRWPRLTSLVACALGLSAGWGRAQTAAVGSNDPSRGLTLLPGSAAMSDEATALVYNPAGLSHSGRFDAWYLHERANTQAQTGDALFLSTAIADWVGVGIAGEWLRDPGGVSRRSFQLGAAVGPRLVSLGASLKWLSGGGPAGGLTTLDLGVQSQPLRWLAFGALVRNLNAPANASTSLPREWGVAVGLRPFGERLGVGVDWLIPELRPVGLSRLQYTLEAAVTGGLRVSLGLSHGLGPAQPLAFQAGLGVDLEHLGYTQGVALSQGQLDWQFAARVSVDAFESIVPAHRIAVVGMADLGGGGLTLGSLLGVEAEDRYLALLRFLDRARLDPKLDAVVLKIEGASIGLSRADELRGAILRLRQAGKKVFGYVLSATDVEYVVGAACDGLYAAPQAMMVLDGLRSSVVYFGGAAESLGVTVDVARVGDYKSSPDQFTRKDMSKEQRETIDAYLDASARTVAEHVAADRHLAPERWQAALDEGLKPVRREKELGTIDGLLTAGELDQLLQKEVPGATVDPAYRPFATREPRWGVKQKIAVVPVLGNISGGKNQPSPLGGPLAAGAQSFIEALTQAAADPQVAAIVVRVDSGGGDGLASDLMYRAVLEAKKKKPVVSSMGDVAASGGYYVAMGADEVFASPTTLTGSIGVFYAKPAVEKLAEGLGISQVSINRGKLAGITDLYEPWSPAQRAAVQRWVDDFYDTFITEVAARRGLSKAEVDRVARGRVWSGTDALAHHLVDQLGGLWEAVERAKAKAGVAGEDVEVAIARPKGSLLGSLVGAAAPSALEQALPAVPQPPAFEALGRALGQAAWLLDGPRPQARLEWLIELE